MEELTTSKFKKLIAQCRDIFSKKLIDYGTAWRILRIPSLTDQIHIKANRIRGIQEHGKPMINENQQTEFIGIINYSIILLIQLELGVVSQPDMESEKALELYDQKVEKAFELMKRKNHDYGEVWKEMRVVSLTDLIIQKLFRVKSIDTNDGVTLLSEGIDANFLDIINYSIFALIHLGENNTKKTPIDEN
ncbi:MAG: DUF1599 domain-containing protein [Flavobacteriaceae bacterium]|nr:DUF1599 domain-containing protein [Flavobacteriaceae bacterium]MCY4267982.1 DUF1599 domain-containing protein [Flavobacteriaceae bacterium]MCY4299320.1 DUF1599 domain-containing protein [Flavobacteriaceae bacterium]